MKKYNGVIIYNGASRIDGKDIVVIATGLTSKSTNTKTGDMVQTWILRADVEPHHAIKTGADVSICGDCVHRGINGKERTCYVTTHQAPLSVYRAWKRGNYPDMTGDLTSAAELLNNKMIRLGSYGDPAAVPVYVWQAITATVTSWTGYTHQWKGKNDAYAKFCMASADSEKDRSNAIKKGFRTFRIKTEAMPVLKGESVCPATTAAALDCATCGACKGTTGSRKGTIVLDVHGSGSKWFKAA
jgi:hypothetical protein